MRRFARVLLSAMALLGLCAPIAHGDDDDEPRILSQSATPVTQTTANFNARIDPEDDDGVAYYFQYGPANSSNGYSKATAWFWFDGETTRDVSVQVTGLTPGTNYQFRTVAENDDDDTRGSKVRFSTLATAPAGPEPTPQPALGETVVAEVASGTVLVKEKGSSQFEPLATAEAVPVNSTFDTTQGTVVLETALANGSDQDGAFWGGKFQVRQPPSGKGMTEIALRGGSFASCSKGNSRLVTQRKKKKGAVRELWGKDHGGRFKTSGKGSVATVRGTSWYTADRCDGTLTKVKSGAVKVKERGTGRSKLLRAGQSFLARLPH